MNYYIKIQNRAYGPFTSEKLRSMFKLGNIDGASLISTDKMNWREAASFSELFEPSSAPASSAPSSPSSPFAPSSSVQPAATSSPTAAPFAVSSQPCWFLSLDGQTGSGPYAASDVAAAVVSGRANGSSLVWREGENARTLFDEPEFSYLFAPSRQTPNAQAGYSSASAQPPSSLAARISRRYRAYWLSCLLTFVVPLLGVLLYVALGLLCDGDAEAISALATLILIPCCWGAPVICSLVAYIFFLMFVHGFWRSLPRRHDITSPGAACGLLLIPFFCLYWNFIVFYQGAGYANTEVKKLTSNESQQTQISETLALLYAIGMIICPFVSFFLTFPLLGQMRNVGVALANAVDAQQSLI